MEITNEIKYLFRPAYDAESETITAEGYQWEINWTSIQSKLIYLAGRYCDRFASDINIDVFTIMKQLEHRVLKSGTHLYGFREDGVDSNSFVINRYSRQYEYSNLYGAQYRALWRLDIEVRDGDIEMKLYPVERSISQSRMREALAASSAALAASGGENAS